LSRKAGWLILSVGQIRLIDFLRIGFNPGALAGEMSCAQKAISRDNSVDLPLRPACAEYFASVFQKYVFSFAHPVPTRGALRDRHE
jgi:hypothetical protein